jgi:hypothetical protein
LRSPRHDAFIPESPTGNSKGNSVWSSSAFAKSKPSLQAGENTLDVLEEGDLSPNGGSARSTMDSAQLAAFLSPTFGSFNDKGLKRSASTAQMKDIKLQMTELKGRLSTLRDQARADSMKRRSLQSLRTPSPFTHARIDQWYAGTQEALADGAPPPSEPERPHSSADLSSIREGSTGVAENPSIPDTEEVSLISSYSSADEGALQTQLSPAEAHIQTPVYQLPDTAKNEGLEEEAHDEGAAHADVDDLRTENGSDEEIRGSHDDAASESGESFYHDTVQNQMSHEDREDAFDYEHFFLHSAMGSMSRRHVRRRDSQGSFGSEDSVETTRGPVAPIKTPPNASRIEHRSRRGSATSTSTTDSFLTATEGQSSRTATTTEGNEAAVATMPQRTRTQTPETAKRSTFGPGLSDSPFFSSPTKGPAVPRSQSSAETLGSNRPSVASFESFGTNRSFPLVNRPKTSMNHGVLTPRDSPDRDELKKLSETLMGETNSIYEKVHENNHGGIQDRTAPIEALPKEDQLLVERLVASLGKCVLGLTESGRVSPESTVFRKRIERARRLLEGFEED